MDSVVTAEVLGDQVAREAVDAGRHGRVRREDHAGAGRLQRLVERELLRLHELADALEAEEAGVALVGVEHLGLRCPGDAAEGAQRAYAADAEQQLLLQPVLAATAVEPVGDIALRGIVALDIGVEHEQRDASHVGAPDVRAQGTPTGEPDLDDHRRAVGLAQQRQRQPVGVQDGVGLLLPAVARERLPEVAGAVEQPDADDRHTEVGRRLQVVTGEDAQPAGVLRQHLGDAELGREVGDRPWRVGTERLVPPVAGEVLLEAVGDPPQVTHEVGIVGQLGPALRGHLTEEPDGILADLVPERPVDPGEEVLRLGVPGPPQVGHDGRQRLQGLGQDGADGESSDRSHSRHPRASSPVVENPPAGYISIIAVSPLASSRYVGRLTSDATSPTHVDRA